MVTNFQSSYEQVKDGYNGIMMDLDNPDYDGVIDKMLKLNSVLRNNLKGFKYLPEIDKWKGIFN